MVSVVSFKRVEPALHLVGGVHHVGAEKVEGGGGERLGIAGPKFVAGDLLADEAVVGLVFIEGLDDVIAIAPRVWAKGVVLEAIALGVAREVEPVARPAFAVVRRGEQPVDEPFVSVG